MSSPPNRPAHSVFFPVAPAGVTIIPFSQFIEHGIRASDGEDGIERDGLGIPTIALRVKHDTDVSKTNPERPRKSAKEMRAARPAFRKEWWEDWAEGEDLRNHGPYDANAAPVDRFHQAASDFHKYRKFPPLSTNVQWLWDQFRIFAGLLGTTPVWHRASDKLADDEDDEPVSDDDFEDQSQNRGGGDRKFHRLRPRAPYELYGKKAVVVQDDVEIRGLLDAARAEKDAKAAHFLQDPARGIQIFLSSYMKNEGIIWSDRNLVNAPHLLRFFVNYLLRNHVLPDEASERSLRAALVTIDVAATELPMTSKISKAIPDDFSRACQGFVGRFLDEFSDDESEPNRKRVKPNPSDDATFESVLEKENVVLINKDDVLPAEDDPVDVSNEWDSPGAPAEDAWAPAAPPSLLPMVGQVGALLPDTHTSGVVESSVRRIKAIYPPSPAAGTASDAEAVERALEGKLHRMVFAPWMNWAGVPDGGPNPPVLSEPKMVRNPGRKSHDVRTDKITVLVSAQTAGMLSVGMGLGGTWVELVSKGAPEDEKKERYWYLDEMTMMLPSYWLVPGSSSDP